MDEVNGLRHKSYYSFSTLSHSHWQISRKSIYQAVAMVTFGLIFLLTIVIVVSPHDYQRVQLNGLCPRISYITNLYLPSFLGWYFGAFSNMNNRLCHRNQGQTMFVVSTDTHTRINVEICCRSAVRRNEALCGSNVGSGIITPLPQPGSFAYQFNNSSYPIYILDTDYNNFLVVYGCKAGFENSREELVYVLTRGFTLNSESKRKVRTVLKNNGVKWSDVKKVKQGPSIPYTPLIHFLMKVK